uniref:Uncharacterized protein n=1 Tax=Anguilla anguilla TaxID=7936 RepID=A0A0E9QHH3_ANGAN
MNNNCCDRLSHLSSCDDTWHVSIILYCTITQKFFVNLKAAQFHIVTKIKQIHPHEIYRYRAIKKSK